MKLLSILRIAILVGTLVAPFPTCAGAGITSENWRVADPLVYSDLIIEGVIAGVGVRKLSFDEAGIEPIPNFTPIVGTFEVVSTRLLRGTRVESSLTYELGASFRPRAGQRMVLCAMWVPRLKSYQVVNDDSALEWDGTEWRRVSGDENLDDPKLMARVHDALPEVVVSEADVVAVGRLRVLPEPAEHRRNGLAQKVVRLSIDVDDLVRGAPQAGSEITFLAASDDINVERIIAQGGQWMVALRRNDSELWLGDVMNGLLKIDAGRLKLAGWRSYHLSVSDMKRAVSESAHESKE